MNGFVLDCSAALAWCFEDEASAEADALLERLETETAAVPFLWYLEIANMLVVAERRRRITPAGSAAFLETLNALPIEGDLDFQARTWSEILSLARSQSLSAYDAAYIELAMRKGLPLATRDRRLASAAASVGVPVIAAGPQP